MTENDTVTMRNRTTTDTSDLDALARRAPATDDLFQIADWLAAHSAAHLSPIEQIELAEQLITRRRFLIGAGALGLGVITGCGTDEQAAAPTATIATRMVKHVFGETEVPLNPQRIATLDTFFFYGLAALGKTPITMAGPNPDFVFNFIKELDPTLTEMLKGKFAADEIVFAGDISTPNFEVLAQITPDLIVCYDYVKREGWEKLQAIAPTVALTLDMGPDAIAPMRLTADISGVSTKFEESYNAFLKRLDTVRATYKDHFANMEYAHFSVFDSATAIIARIPLTPGHEIMTALGAVEAKSMTAFPNNDYGEVSLEMLPGLDADVLIIPQNPGEAVPDTITTLVKQSAAGKLNQIFMVNGIYWGYPSLTSFEKCLDEIEARLTNVDVSGDFR